MIRVVISLPDPQRLIAPITRRLRTIVDGLRTEGTISDAEHEAAVDGMMTVLPELLKWKFTINGDQAHVSFTLEDDAAACTMLRHAAIEALRLKP